eukprot:gene1697-802_t
MADGRLLLDRAKVADSLPLVELLSPDDLSRRSTTRGGMCNGLTLLHLAAGVVGEAALVRALLRVGADPAAVDTAGRTAAEFARWAARTNRTFAGGAGCADVLDDAAAVRAFKQGK